MEPSRKKPKFNAFVLFAKEFAKSYNLNMPFDDLIQYVSPHWEALDANEKESYKEQARSNRPATTPQSHQKPTSYQNKAKGEEEKRKIQLQTMAEEVRTLIGNEYEAGKLHDAEFYILCGSSFYADENDIFPAEFAISKFSLREGITKNFHVRINPGSPPSHVARGAQIQSNASFKYPVPRGNDRCDDYIVILLDILNFLKPAVDFPSVFFVEGNFDGKQHEDYDKFVNNKRILEKILEECGEYQIASENKIYPINFLLYFLKFYRTKNLEGDQAIPFNSLDEAHEEMQKLKIDLDCFVKPCKYHEENDAAMHCCLAKTQCYGYVIISYLCVPNIYPLKEGNHFPKGCEPIES